MSSLIKESLIKLLVDTLEINFALIRKFYHLHHGISNKISVFHKIEFKYNARGWGRESKFVCCRLPVIMWFLFGEVSSSSGCLGWATLFYCGTP